MKPRSMNTWPILRPRTLLACLAGTGFEGGGGFLAGFAPPCCGAAPCGVAPAAGFGAGAGGFGVCAGGACPCGFGACGFGACGFAPGAAAPGCCGFGATPGLAGG